LNNNPWRKLKKKYIGQIEWYLAMTNSKMKS
jgi:hypothetical protein